MQNLRFRSQALLAVTVILFLMTSCGVQPQEATSRVDRKGATTPAAKNTADGSTPSGGSGTKTGTTGTNSSGSTTNKGTNPEKTGGTSTTGGNTNTTNTNTNTNTNANSDASCYKGSAFICKIENLIIAKTNAYRTRSGITALIGNPKISFVSRDWSYMQASAGGISHDGFPSLREANYDREFGTDISFSGENVAMTGGISSSSESDATAEAVASDFAVMWYNSPGHRQNMMASSFREIGVGVYRTSGGYWYATQIFK